MSNLLSPKIAFAIVSFCIGQLGDGLNIFQGIYLNVELGWNETSVGIALSLMGLTALLVQTVAGDIVDKTSFDRRFFLVIASIFTAASASAVMIVQGDEHLFMYATKIVEGIASSFIIPCLAALTLANFGPDRFDEIMASNIFWGHVGSVTAALAAGGVAYAMYPDIKYCFLVIGISGIVAVFFIGFLPQGDHMMGRGLVSQKENALISKSDLPIDSNSSSSPNDIKELEPTSYAEIFSDRKTVILSLTLFFFHFSNANILLVLGEIMGGDDGQNAIPLIAGAIVIAQLTMSIATVVGGKLTTSGMGRKPLFLLGLISLPIRCLLIVYWKDAAKGFLLSTQVMDGIGGGLLDLIHPFLIADITYGTGRFNVLMGLTVSFKGLGATLSNFLGQMAVEYFGHAASIMGSFVISLLPIVLFHVFMPETLGDRSSNSSEFNTKMFKCGEEKNKSEQLELEMRDNGDGNYRVLT